MFNYDITEVKETYNALGDTKIFFPIAEKLVDPLRKIKLTPNNITIISTICTFLTIYYLNLDNIHYAVTLYTCGYILDCVDGMMARKYDMTSNYGMALDTVSDTISNTCIIIYLINKYGVDNRSIHMLLFMTLMLNIYNGMNEALSSYEATGDDNFYQKKVEQLKSEYNITSLLYIHIMNIMYKTYKILFPVFNKDRIKKWLTIMKEFGPGNYCLFFIFILYSIKKI